jgi:bla regulator protein blaR1
MLIAWIVFVLITGRVLTMGAVFADRVAAAARRSRRFVWLAALLGTAFWPGVAIMILHITRAALARGWGTGQPRHFPMLVLTVPKSVGVQWLTVTLLVFWGVASALLLTRLAIFAYATGRWRRALPMVDVGGVRVRLSRDAGPAVVGVCAMDIVVPAWVLLLEPSMQRLVLRHETAHREARDIQLLWLAALLTALVPWNLLLWWQASRLRLAIEMDCDARVLREDPRPAAYARLLLHIAQHASSSTLTSRLAPALAGRTTRLEYRLAAMRRGQNPPPLLWRAAYALAAAGTVMLASAIQAPALPRSLTPTAPVRFIEMKARVRAPSSGSIQ